MDVCCCVCGRLRVDGEWIEEYVDPKEWINYGKGGSHGYCPKHKKEMIDKIHEDSRKKLAEELRHTLKNSKGEDYAI